jgi:hypothetical protein
VSNLRLFLKFLKIYLLRKEGRMDIEGLKETLRNEVSDNSRLEDNGIGRYEYGSIIGVDKQIGVEIDISEVVIDISGLEVIDEDGNPVKVTLESMKENEMDRFELTVTRGDYEAYVTVVLTKIDGMKATYKIS